MKGFLFIIFIAFSAGFIQSCSKGSDPNGPSGVDTTTPPPPPPPPVPDSVYSIDRIAQPSGFGCWFHYDSKGRVSSFGRYFNSYNFDTTTIIYDLNDKVVRMVRYRPNGIDGHEVTPTIFEYQAGRVVRFITKYKKRQGEYDLTYLSSTNNPAEISNFDSLFYNPAGKIIQTKYYSYPVSYPSPPKLLEYKNISYQPGNDSFYQRIDSYREDINGNYPLDWRFDFNDFTSIANPFFNKIPFYSLLETHANVTFYFILTSDVNPRGHSFLTDIPRMSTRNTISSNITYIYQDGLLRQSYLNGQNYYVVNYYYKKVPK